MIETIEDYKNGMLNAQKAYDNEEFRKRFFIKMHDELDARQARSAWERGVKDYAHDHIETLEDRCNCEQRFPMDKKECKKWLLNGAESWEEHSYGGCSLIYDGDIAERLCTPSELKRTKQGEKMPNSRQTWLDLQTNALMRASGIVCLLYERIMKEES